MVSDMRRLLEKGRSAARKCRAGLVSKKGGVQSVSLLDTATLEATFSRDAGSLVPPANKLRSLRPRSRSDQGTVRRGPLDQGSARRVALGLGCVRGRLHQSHDGLRPLGLHGEAVMRQAESFAALLAP
jgi:S-DNA-T family DNA segregation ATPase FtsK/SpoIIIE